MSFRYKIFISGQARADLYRLERHISERIIKKLRYFESLDDPLGHAEPLTGPLQGKYRFRIGEYRATFIIEPNDVITILIILTIKHRRDSYR